MQVNRLHQMPNFARKFGPERCVNTATGPNQSDRTRIIMTDAPFSGNATAIQEIISRAEAKARGLVHYYTGKPCKRGHVAIRFVNGWCCTVCKREAYAIWAVDNVEKIKRKDREYSKKNREKKTAYRREWIKNNREADRAKSRQWAKDNPEKARARLTAWKKANPDKVRENHVKRRARKNGADGAFTAKQLVELLAKQKGKCTICFCSIKNGYHVDHIKPLALGGSNWISNIQLLCRTCNLTKSSKDPFDFALSIGRLV